MSPRYRSSSLRARDQEVRLVRPRSGPRLVLTVPVPPSINNAYLDLVDKQTLTVRRVLTAEASTFKADVGWRVASALQWQRWPAPPYPEYSLSITLCIYWADRRRRDITNCIKLLEDAVCGVLQVDDRHVCEFHLQLGGIDYDTPRCEVVVELLDGELPIFGTTKSKKRRKA